MKLNDAIKNGLKLTDLEKRCLQRLIDQEYYNDDEYYAESSGPRI